MINPPVILRVQKGAALIFIAFVIGLASLAVILKIADASNVQAEQEAKTNHNLNEAKQALIAWAVNHPNHPGIMPFPDRGDDIPQGYDDKSDCVNVGANGSHLIGKLPLLSDTNCVSPQHGLGIDIRDATGERLWYSVSLNLVRMSDASATPIINPSIVNNPNHPWFVVRDRKGVIISDRVAAVIFAPGLPSGGQDRSGGVANANQYLDKIVMSDGTPYKNYGYQDPATNPVQEFIIGDHFKNVAPNDPTYKDQTIEPYYYNDKLVYITIDELMAALEKRVLMTARNALKNYSVSEGGFPHAAKLGAINNYSCESANLKGFLPVEVRNTSCSCAWGATRACTCSFANANSISFTKATAFSATNVSGSCSRLTSATNTCICSGAGYCKNGTGTQTFQCDAGGNCTSDVSGFYTFSGTFNAATMGCSLPLVPPSNCSSSFSASCNGAGTLSFNACGDQPFNSLATNSVLPTWFMVNLWHNYLYYDRTTNLTVGSKSGVDAVLISTGAAMAAQTRPSCSESDYLDSVENTNNDLVYEGTYVNRTSTYNDQTVIIAP